MKTFRYPQSIRNLMLFCSVLGISTSFWIIQREGIHVGSIALFASVLFAVTLGNLSEQTKIVSDDHKITHRGMFGTTTLEWSHIDDFCISPQFISLVSTAQNKCIRVRAGSYGYSLEPLDVLRSVITQKVSGRLTVAWQQLRLPLTYSFPGLALSATKPYLLLYAVIVWAFVLVALAHEGPADRKLEFIAIGLLTLIPILAKVYWRGRGRLTLEQEGLRHVDRKNVFIRWEAVRELVVRESSIGYGSILVKGIDQYVLIPRSLPKCGEILAVISRRTSAQESYARENWWSI